ncbi:hypothetical protein [Actinomadura sp. NTSP31]|uniref:hypothetical protein n=1 Tax=Actinomadura sp. NTSP31 TaxID=1735447 RepID=UPI0035BFE3F9
MVEAGLRVERPRVAAARVSELVTAIAESMAGQGGLNKAATEVGPQPCDGVEVVRAVSVADGGGEEPWYVDYSPYVMMYIGYVDLPSGTAPAPLMGVVHDRLVARGWRSLRADPEVVIESPYAGYGARLVAVAEPPGPRIGVYVSSPCFRCPEGGS